MIERHALIELENSLNRQAAVVLIGPRQVGKTTLALALAEKRPSTYLDLEAPSDLAKLSDPETFLSGHEDNLVIIDEIQRYPDLFPVLRGLIDRGRRRGRKTGRFLMLGSASIDLLRQASETLAGRVAMIELGPVDITEPSGDANGTEKLWLRGGFPESFLAVSDDDSFAWREDFIRTYLERDIPMLGPRVPAETLRRFWTMLAHQQVGLLNASKLASGLGVSGQTIARYTDLLVDLLLVRRLAPVLPNVGKRLVKSPRIIVRDSGLVHALLGIVTRDDLFGHPVVGPSWEGFVIENLLSAAPKRIIPGFYRTAAGAEMDLVLDLPGRERWAVEIKRRPAPKPQKGFYQARQDLNPDRCYVVYPGNDRYPLAQGVEAIGLQELATELLTLGRAG